MSLSGHRMKQERCAGLPVLSQNSLPDHSVLATARLVPAWLHGAFTVRGNYSEGLQRHCFSPRATLVFVRSRKEVQLKSFAFTLAATLALLAGHAMALDKPTGEPILTITGAVSQPNDGTRAVFDAKMLDALPGRDAKMETPWTQGNVEFTGPLLREVLKAAGARGSKLIVKALNDYSAEVPMEDVDKLDTMLADRMNGEVMNVRDKGPLMLVYPFDLDKSIFNEKYFGRSVWQIEEIEVVP